MHEGKSVSSIVRGVQDLAHTWNTPHLASNAGLLGDLRATDLHVR